MGSWRSPRFLAQAAALLFVGVGAFAATRHAVEFLSGNRPPHGSVKPVAAGAGTIARAVRPGKGLPGGGMEAGSREAAETGAPGAPGTGEAARDPAAEANPAAAPPEGADPPDPLQGQVRIVRLSVDLSFFRLQLSASPDTDPATGEAPAVASGRPPEMDIADFVANGAASVDRAAELVGRRRPEVEEGVPVSLTGRVVEAEGGAPVVGARLIVSSTFYVRRYFYDHHLREVARAETGADGVFRIDRLNADPAHFGAGGRLYVTVTADGHAPALAVPLGAVSPGVANRLPDVALACAAQTLRGRVLDFWEGLPVVGARVYATGAIDPISYPKDERAALFVGAPAGVTDADGRFVLEGLGSGLETISVHGGDDCAGTAAVVLPHEGEFLIRTRQIRGHIEGTTVDGSGDPVSLVTVEGGANTTHSFADGRFVLENFRGDVVTISFTHPDFPPVVLPGVRDGTTGLVIRLEVPRPLIVLQVRDRDTAAPVACVQLVFGFADGRAPPAATSPQRLSAGGRYEVRVPEGAATLSVSAEGRRTEEVPLAGRVDGETVPVALAPASGR